MPYVLFRYEAAYTTEDLLNGLSLAFLINPSTLKGYDEYYQRYMRKTMLSKLTLPELVYHVLTQEIALNACRLIYFPTDFDSDKNLISSYGDTYIGCVIRNYKKPELLVIANHHQQLELNVSLREHFSPSNYLDRCINDDLDIEERELQELKYLADISAKPIYDVLDARIEKCRNALSKHPKLLSYDF